MAGEVQWGEQDDLFLEGEYSAGAHIVDIATEMGISARQVKSRLFELGLTATSAKKQWTDEEDFRLNTAFHAGHSISNMAYMCDASEQQIKRRLKKLTLSRMSEFRWSSQEMEFVRLNVRELGYKETGRRIGRSEGAVIEFLKRAPFQNPMARTNYYDPADIDEIVRLRLETGLTWDEIGDLMGRTGEACRTECGWRVAQARKDNPSLGVPIKSARPIAEPWSDQEDDKLLRLKEAGLTFYQISKQVDRTAEASRARWRVLCRRNDQMSTLELKKGN